MRISLWKGGENRASREEGNLVIPRVLCFQNRQFELLIRKCLLAFML